jgi:hypothetical protein
MAVIVNERLIAQGFASHAKAARPERTQADIDPDDPLRRNANWRKPRTLIGATSEIMHQAVAETARGSAG